MVCCLFLFFKVSYRRVVVLGDVVLDDDDGVMVGVACSCVRVEEIQT